MTTWIALVRGINVGGKGMLPMKELVALLEDLHCEQVKTYVQSGNAVFRSSEPAGKLAEKIEKRVHALYRFQPRVVLLSRKELERAAKANPYPQSEKEHKTLPLMF